MEFKRRKIPVLWQKTSRNGRSPPHKGGDLKLTAKKSITRVKKSRSSDVKKGKKSRTPGQADVCDQLNTKRIFLSKLIENGTIKECEKVRYLHMKDSHTNLGDDTLYKSDDYCSTCGVGGDLLCCDQCPSTFHLSCTGLPKAPPGDWYCAKCRCASCGDSQFSSDKTAFNDLTSIMCEQCDRLYHVKCSRAGGLRRGLRSSSLPQGGFLCGDSCKRVFRGLRSLVGICTPMEGGFSWTLLRSAGVDHRKSDCFSKTEVNVEHDSKLSRALSVMHECLDPIVDSFTKIEIISHVMYNRKSAVKRLNCHGFYTMLLEEGDELISVAAFRVHGAARLAEIPLIGTRIEYQLNGMCRRLMSAIENMLHSLGVERLVLPAIPEMVATWKGAFGFQSMDESLRLQLMDLNIMRFPGTSILYKRLEDARCQYKSGRLSVTLRSLSL